MSRPTDEQIIAEIRPSGEVTYAIANGLRMAGHKGLSTAWVRRRLRALEKAGQVAVVESPYSGLQNMLWWKVTS